MDCDDAASHNRGMAKVRTNFKAGHPRHYIREWRRYRGLTIERLAERVGITAGALSQLENGKFNYTQPTLESLAEALACSPGDLLIRDPSSDDRTLIEMVESLPVPVRESLRLIIDEMRKAS